MVVQQRRAMTAAHASHGHVQIGKSEGICADDDYAHCVTLSQHGWIGVARLVQPAKRDAIGAKTIEAIRSKFSRRREFPRKQSAKAARRFVGDE
jgi:hypothetical protein